MKSEDDLDSDDDTCDDSSNHLVTFSVKVLRSLVEESSTGGEKMGLCMIKSIKFTFRFQNMVRVEKKATEKAEKQDSRARADGASSAC